MSEFGIGHVILILAILYFVVRPIFRGYREGRNESPAGQPTIAGTGDFATEVVGESHYQGNLLALCGSRAPDGVHKYFVATLVPEDANPHDPKAVRVDIESKTVGYLARPVARVWREKNGSQRSLRCKAVVRGGWDRGADDKGHFGVWLDLPN